MYWDILSRILYRELLRKSLIVSKAIFSGIKELPVSELSVIISKKKLKRQLSLFLFLFIITCPNIFNGKRIKNVLNNPEPYNNPNPPGLLLQS